ncbi:hypothetical protein HGM15179_020254 [Zosterops borbonicus]|uniref:ribonuclease H n=1 Tax=Zosterops borbonicus TaxID=364589 RepID=A0A8K1D9J2_9PASS|nr:hypothetical protein HGM15179_020254 [Zosterops borbonicus]
MQPLGPLPPYSKIMQGPNEPYVQFVEKLTQAIKLQVQKEHAREEVLEEMAFSNMNERCHAAILSLPLKPPPTLQHILEVCEQKDLTQVPSKGPAPDLTILPDVTPPILTTTLQYEPFQLSLTKSILLSDSDWHSISVSSEQVPTINREAPRKRYHWKVLPQGMKNSPVICQWYVSSLLSPVHAAAEKAIIHHYMDDVLVCAPNEDLLTHPLDLKVNALVAAGFELQELKIQRMPPWKYLGQEISKWTIVPQKLAIKTKIRTLADAHQLCGALNWARPWLGLTTEDLAPLFNLLKGREELSSPRSLTREAQKALEKVQGKKSWDAIKHLVQASFMGIPKALKTDNRPAYKSREFRSFLQQWGVDHKKGIPHYPTGHAVVERTHRDLKRVFCPQQQVLKTEPPSIRLAMNSLNCSFETLNLPIVCHFGGSQQLALRAKPPVLVKDPETGRTEGPHDLVMCGRGSPELTMATVKIPFAAHLLQLMLLTSLGWIVPQPKVNIWTTLAKAIGQDHICLSSTAATDPMSTCLVGIPFKPEEFPAVLLKLRDHYNGKAPAIRKRDLASLHLDCNSEITHWSRAKATAVIVFLPWVSVAKAMGELGRLECWVANQANLTSNAFSDLLSDEEIRRQVTLQNRAAIEYLLLLHNHKCKEFEGLCCFNLSSKAEDIHKTISKMKDLVGDIKRETKDWLSRLFKDWGLLGWVGSLVKTGLFVLFIIILISIAFGLIKCMVYWLISNTTTPPEVNQVTLPTAPADGQGLEGAVPLEEDENPENILPPKRDWPIPLEEWPTNQQWFEDLDPKSEYLDPQVQFTSF